jgi:sulfate adenylyltransferase large subunit
MPLATLPEDAAISSGFSIDGFLALERGKDLFRFSTAGSVDDGKSTLIGRLLVDTQSIYEDQLRSIEGKGTTAPGQIDFALLTDGLRAEREQGITIDVAYRYFSTARRKFIIADTPGHEQYTRNMATGCSTADAAVVLIDARKGVLPQSRRHAYIASLLGVRNILVAVSKMDLVDYNESVFRAIEAEFGGLLTQIAVDTGNPIAPVFVPVSALLGDNIVNRSAAMTWYEGPSLLELLEAFPSSTDSWDAPFRFPVQRVLRPDHSFRGFAGQIASGTVRVRDRVTVLPSGRDAIVTSIVTYDGDLPEARTPCSVTLTLDRELDISRGDMLVSNAAPATVANHCEASLVWMDQRSLEAGRRFLLRLASQTVPAIVWTLESRVDIGALAHRPAEALEINDIGVARLQLLRPIALDRYAENRATGAFILVDPESNNTVAAGMITDAWLIDRADSSKLAVRPQAVTPEERAARWGHRGGILELQGPPDAIDSIEHSLFAAGVIAIRADSTAQLAWIAAAGLIAISATAQDGDQLAARVGELRISVDAFDSQSAAAVHQLLERSGIVLPKEGFHFDD